MQSSQPVQAFICHCYWVGGTSNLLTYLVFYNGVLLPSYYRSIFTFWEGLFVNQAYIAELIEKANWTASQISNYNAFAWVTNPTLPPKKRSTSPSFRDLHFNRKGIFQPLFLRDMLVFGGGTCLTNMRGYIYSSWGLKTLEFEASKATNQFNPSVFTDACGESRAESFVEGRSVATRWSTRVMGCCELHRWACNRWILFRG